MSQFQKGSYANFIENILRKDSIWLLRTKIQNSSLPFPRKPSTLGGSNFGVHLAIRREFLWKSLQKNHAMNPKIMEIRTLEFLKDKTLLRLLSVLSFSINPLFSRFF